MKETITRRIEMSTYNFDNKRFALIQNSESGQVNSETFFEYKQQDNLVTADYFGGTIKYGKNKTEFELGMVNQRKRERSF